jgi:hypothetical protein
MTKQFILGTLLGLGLVSSAAADDKQEAQKKVDTAKTETCEKTKKFLADQAAKGRCKDESAAAQKITCSASTFKDVTDLNTKCAKAPAAKDDKTKPADEKPADAGVPKCRAMVDGKSIAEVEEASSTKCSTKLMDAVRAVKCTTDDMKGKKVEYTVNHDHKVGKTTLKDRATSLTCAKVIKK